MLMMKWQGILTYSVLQRLRWGMSWSSSIGIDTMLKYSDSTPLIYQEKIKNSTIKLSLEAERTALAARNNQDPLDSFLWDAEIPHQTWLLLSFQKAFSSIKEGISVSFALHCCQPNVWSDWSPTCFTLFTLNKFSGLKKNIYELYQTQSVNISCKQPHKKFRLDWLKFIGIDCFEIFFLLDFKCSFSCYLERKKWDQTNVVCFKMLKLSRQLPNSTVIKEVLH